MPPRSAPPLPASPPPAIAPPARPWRDGQILAVIWLVAIAIDGLWLWQDQAPPAWDQGEHLTRALNYWRLLQAPEWASSDWWTSLWRLSPSYRAPFVYLTTVPLFQLLGRGFDQAVLVNSLFTGGILLLVYGLGRQVFDRSTGLWAAAVCALVPSLFLLRIDYLLDTGLILGVLAGLTCLTGWRAAGTVGRWGWAIAFGACFGLILLTKPTGILFLFVPLLWIALESLRRPRWHHGLQWVVAAGVALLIAGPWIQTNWLTILTTSNKSNSTWLAAELNPDSPWSVWTYYGRMLPRMVTPLLLWASLGSWGLGLLAQWAGWLKIPTRTSSPSASSPDHPSPPALAPSPVPNPTPEPAPDLAINPIPNPVPNPNPIPPLPPEPPPHRSAIWPGQGWWLLTYVLGTYAILSLLHNKDPRHIVPYIPVVVLLLVRGLTLWPGRLGRFLRFGMVSALAVLMLGSLFPLPAALSRGMVSLSGLAKYPYQGQPWPHPAVIETVLTTEPYLRSTVGVVPNTAEMNPMNVDFYGALRDFRVFGREVGFNAAFAPLDARSLTWVLAKTGAQGPQNSGNEAKTDLQTRVAQSPDYRVRQTWDLPDATQLVLYHREPAVIQVAQIQGEGRDRPPETVTLTGVTTPPSATPGSIVPITYTLQGPWSALADGCLIVSWMRDPQTSAPNPAPNPTSNSTPNPDPNFLPSWIHDHGIGLGHLYAGLEPPVGDLGFEVVERLGMGIPAAIAPGTYRLQAEYLNRQTGQALPLSLTTALTVVPGDPVPGPEPDLVGQLHTLSQGLSQGILDPIFNTVGRINQYDPIQDYLLQAEQAMTHRLQRQPDNLEWLYTRLLAQVLQQRAGDAIATLNHITQIAPDNPYHWLYLGFVHLYSWQPGAANRALDRAAALAPHMPELKVLQAIAALQRLNLVRTWQKLQESGLLRS